MHLGIDLGTSYTKLGYWHNGKLINLAGEGICIPTVASCLLSTGQLFFGNLALRLNEPDAYTARFFKLELRRNPGFHLGQYHLPLLLQHFFTFLNEKYVLPTRQQVDSITIGVPNYFGLNARRALINSLRHSFGIDKVTILLEPAAAAIGYNLTHPGRQLKGDILSIDIGGGTSDFSFITIARQQNQVILESQLQTGHDTFSGSEVDRAILRNILFPAYKMQTGRDISAVLIKEKSMLPRQNYLLNQLMRTAENIKKELGSSKEIYLNIPDFYEGESLQFLVDQDMFVTQTKPLFNRLEEYINEIIKYKALNLGLYANDKWNLDYILLAGGASLTWGVKEILTSLFPGAPIIMPDNTEFNVLTGLCTWEEQRQYLAGTKIKGIYPFNFYIERFNLEQPSPALDKIAFDTANLELDITGKYKICTLEKESPYNLSPREKQVKFRIYEVEEQDDAAVERLTGRDLVLEIDASQEESSHAFDIYLDMGNSKLESWTGANTSEGEDMLLASMFADLLPKQNQTCENLKKLSSAHRLLLDDYEKHLEYLFKHGTHPWEDHAQTILYKLYALVQMLNDK